ncbi:MAG: prolipoprotein diacylglyceryl transferase, partial [Lachnospiraceae bacterium]|nr:prolipoprotein diacylglyceryl transferase [Lachnospiraceae bacterium]
CLSLVFLTRRKGLSFLKIADICVLGGILGQICGRWGNFFNREAFGGYSDGLFSMQLPVSAVRQADAITAEMLEKATEEGGLTWISVHPTFLYESLWNLGVFLILYFFVRRVKRWDGQVFFSYLLLYGAGRFWIEGLRTDQLRIPYTSLPVSQCLAGACVVVSTAVLFAKHFSSESE